MAESIHAKMGTLIQETRQTRGLSVEDLARLAGYTRKLQKGVHRIEAYERGAHETWPFIERLLSALDLDPNLLKEEQIRRQAPGWGTAWKQAREKIRKRRHYAWDIWIRASKISRWPGGDRSSQYGYLDASIKDKNEAYRELDRRYRKWLRENPHLEGEAEAHRRGDYELAKEIRERRLAWKARKDGHWRRLGVR